MDLTRTPKPIQLKHRKQVRYIIINKQQCLLHYVFERQVPPHEARDLESNV